MLIHGLERYSDDFLLLGLKYWPRFHTPISNIPVAFSGISLGLLSHFAMGQKDERQTTHPNWLSLNRFSLKVWFLRMLAFSLIRSSNRHLSHMKTPSQSVRLETERFDHRKPPSRIRECGRERSPNLCRPFRMDGLMKSK